MQDEQYVTPSDQKMRWAGLLEIPYISMLQRGLLDAGRVRGLVQALDEYDFKNVLDVGCGLGEGSAVSRCGAQEDRLYVGLDNTLRRIKFAANRYKAQRFLVANALSLPFRDQAFDLTLLIDTSHHLKDEQFRTGLLELKRVSRKYLVVSDPAKTEDQSTVSSFFYKMDRGGCFRHIQQTRSIIESVEGLNVVDVATFRTFPGLYLHAAFIVAVEA